ncbi:MAG TPA: hypothetical protein VL403_01990, partial [Candidatus Kryptonia bacterium]|nr:hypothetical protein [Candidatus Kryptonia bacterium]
MLGIGVGSAALALSLAHVVDLRRAGASMQTITLSGADTLGRGLQDVYTLGLSDPAPGPDGLQITFTAADPTSCVIADSEFGIGQSPKTLTVSAGARRRMLVLQSLAGGTGDCSVSVTSTTPSGWTATPSPLNVSIVQAQLRIRELVHSVSNLAATQPFFVEVGVPAGAGRRLKFIQGLSSGSPNLTVTACSDQPSIATIVNRFGQDVPPPGCEDNPITAPYSRTVPGDFGIDPIAGQSGTVTVSVSAPGMIGDQRPVAVSGSSVTLAGPELLGAGLQDTYSATLSDAAPADQVVTISVADATRCVVGATEQSLGTSSATVSIPAGRYRAEFIVQGVAAPIPPDTTPCTVSVSAGTFGTDSIDIDVVQPGLRIRELASSMSSFAADDPFFVELGVPGANGRLRFVQEWRAGSAPTANAPLPVTVQSDAPAVGTIVNVSGVDAGNDGQESDYVQPGFSRTVPGNLQFDPISGSTTPVGVTATAPGFVSMEQDVTVQATSLGISGPKLLGSGLQDDYAVQLFNAAGHAATQVTVSSLNPGACLVSLTANAQPSASTTVTVAADDSNAAFVVQAVADIAPIDCPLQAVTAGYTDGTLTVQIVQPGIEIRQLGRNIPSDGNNDNFFVEVGVPNTNNTQLQTVQRLTVGPAGDLSIKVCSSHPEIGTIVKQGVDNPPAMDDPPGQGCEDDTIQQAFSQNVPGNLQFDPKTPGFTLVQVFATGFAT